MIFQNYVAKNILKGTSLTLLVLVSMSAFFTFVGQLDDLGVGRYDFAQVFQFVLLKIPGQIVSSLPMAMLIGTILSLGALADNHEIIVVQASGVSLKSFLWMVLKAAVVVSLVSLLLQQYVVAQTETQAYQQRDSAKKNNKKLKATRDIWLKDGLRIVHIKELYLNGSAKGVRVFELNDENQLVKATYAETAKSFNKAWILNDVKQSIIASDRIEKKQYESLAYSGQLSDRLLESVRIDPDNMSLSDLYYYKQFLADNDLSSYAENIVFWRKVYSPLSILLMCSLAVPFVIGSQRGGQAGQRLMISIVIGLSFIVAERFLVRLGEYFLLYPALNTLIPILLFLALNLWLLRRVLR